MSAFAPAQPGWTEKDISDVIGKNMTSLGFNEIEFRRVGTGICTLNLHAEPSEKKLEPGDIVRGDCGRRVKGYHSDVTRMAVVGKPSERHRKICKFLVLTHKETIKNMNAGINISDVYNIFKRTFEQNYEGTFNFFTSDTDWMYSSTMSPKCFAIMTNALKKTWS